MATARQRRAARRRAIRARFPVGTQLEILDSEHSKRGDWIVYAHKGQSLYIRRRGMKSGYAIPCRDFLAIPHRVFYIGG